MKRAQIFSMDFLMAVFIFIAVFGVLLISWGGILDNIVKHNERKDLEIHVNAITEFFVSSGGNPYNWQDDPANAKTIGFARTDRVIDEGKLSTFINADYDMLRDKMLIGGYNFCLKLVNAGVERCEFGEGEDLVVFSRRAVVYNGKADVLEFRIWRYT